MHAWIGREGRREVEMCRMGRKEVSFVFWVCDFGGAVERAQLRESQQQQQQQQQERRRGNSRRNSFCSR